MSSKNLFENECGQQNSLLRLTSHFTTDKSLLLQDGIKNSKFTKNVDLTQNFVNEYLNENTKVTRFAPNTFQMERLFNEINKIDNLEDNKMNLLNDLSNDWSIEHNKNLQEKNENFKNLQWSTEYLSQNELSFDNDIWEDPNYLNTTISKEKHFEQMKKTANELLDTMQDTLFSESDFLNFVENLSNKSLNKPFLTSSEADNLWTTTLNNQPRLNNITSEENFWINEYSKTDLNKVSFWDELSEEWNLAAKSDHPWLDDFQKVVDNYTSYEFDSENPLVLHPDPYEEGLKRLKSHDIVNAVLLFEAAVQKDPNNMLAWQYLGTTQVENEQDSQAIRALKKCLEIKPDNLIALTTLATSYTNESMQKLAFECLQKWLEVNPKYMFCTNKRKLTNNIQPKITSLSVVQIKDFIDLQETYLEAVRGSIGEIDPDIQCCLGILFHLSGEYDKAADCFKTALSVKPQDHILWNKLGATFANGNRNEEAIEAYYQALKLCPGFVRARYNLGIGCMNLGAYKEAVEHFLTALSQQSRANLMELNDGSINTIIKKSVNQMSETIWSTLRLAMSYLNKSDLYTKCVDKDLEFLKTHFNIE